MAQYEVLKPFIYIEDGKAVTHREVGAIIELEGSIAQRNHGKVKRVGKGEPDAEPGTVYDRSEVISAAQEAEHPDPVQPAVAPLEDRAEPESPAEVELSALPEPELESKPRGGRKRKGSDGTES
jgi:hypothetical protein